MGRRGPGWGVLCRRSDLCGAGRSKRSDRVAGLCAAADDVVDQQHRVGPDRMDEPEASSRSVLSDRARFPALVQHAQVADEGLCHSSSLMEPAQEIRASTTPRKRMRAEALDRDEQRERGEHGVDGQHLPLRAQVGCAGAEHEQHDAERGDRGEESA